MIDLREGYIRTPPQVPWTQMIGSNGYLIAKFVVDFIRGNKPREAILAFQKLRANTSKDGTISAITNPDRDGEESGGYAMANSIYILATYPQNWAKTSIFNMMAEPLRGNLVRSMLQHVTRGRFG